MNLFLRIFLSFWLTAALLASSFFLMGRLSGSEAIDHANDLLKSQSETLSTLWQQGNRRAIRHWFVRQTPEHRPLLLDSAANNPLAKRMHREPPLRHKLPTPLKAGIQRHPFGHVSLVVELPDINPPLFLIRQLEPRQMHRLPFWVLPVAALFIISLVSYLLAKILSRRILHLREAVQEISAGDLSARVTLNGKDEVKALANDFNDMADRIQTMMESQRQLVSDASHELRSPLARLRIALELAQRADDPVSALTRIEKEADELENLVTELLSLARLESGQFQLEKKDTDMYTLLQKIVQDANYEAAAKHCEITLDTETLSISIDPVLLSSAVENVIRNAIRYSPENSQVNVSAKPVNRDFVITVEDFGDGVPEEELQQLFQPFTRVSKARERDSGGFGLGLAITGKSMAAHAGKAIAENRAEGGLRIQLILPMA